MYNDSRLETLNRDYANLVADQQRFMEDINKLQLAKNAELTKLRQSLQEKMDRELDASARRFDDRIKELTRHLDIAKTKIPEKQRDIERRTSELGREAERKVA